MSDAEQKTLRDEFAMAAMHGLLASEPHNVNYTFAGEEGTVADQVAQDAFRMADAMMQERMK
jgi:hypothetical protein